MDLSNIFYCIFLSVMKQNSATNLLEDSNPCPCNIQITGPVWNLLNISSVLRWFIVVISYFLLVSAVLSYLLADKPLPKEI